MNRQPEHRGAITYSLASAVDLLNEVRSLVNQALVRAEDRIQEFLAAQGDLDNSSEIPRVLLERRANDN